MSREELLELGNSFSDFKMEEVPDETITELNESNTSVEEKTAMPSNLKIKEIKYGMSILTNLGNYENVRTHIEVVADVTPEDNLHECLDDLSLQVKEWARKAYTEIKQKNKR